jgi:hypothetical protein
MNVQTFPKPTRLSHTPSRQQDKHPLTLVFEAGSRRASVDQAILRQAISEPVLVMDAGNCFNPLRLVRAIRRQTIQVQQVLEQIQVARAFTCFQVVALLEQTLDPPGSVFLLRPLVTFQDEMAPVYERLRLLREVDCHIDRLLSAVAVTVMIKEGGFPGDPLLDWLSALQARAEEIVFPDLVSPPRAVSFF